MAGTPEELVNNALDFVINKHASKFQNLDRDKQCVVADMVRVGRARLTEAFGKKIAALRDQGDEPVLTYDHVKDIFASIDFDAIKEEALSSSVEPSCR
mmetsp:Transcript_44005/g.138306  ORF Transcript_44005/g.138306 Transcript_44005/m.138306 type:complete len:98 (+) Transcript_44005:548-841(+)